MCNLFAKHCYYSHNTLWGSHPYWLSEEQSSLALAFVALIVSVPSSEYHSCGGSILWQSKLNLPISLHVYVPLIVVGCQLITSRFYSVFPFYLGYMSSVGFISQWYVGRWGTVLSFHLLWPFNHPHCCHKTFVFRNKAVVVPSFCLGQSKMFFCKIFSVLTVWQGQCQLLLILSCSVRFRHPHQITHESLFIVSLLYN
jgi:hypothetical protein